MKLKFDSLVYHRLKPRLKYLPLCCDCGIDSRSLQKISLVFKFQIKNFSLPPLPLYSFCTYARRA